MRERTVVEPSGRSGSSEWLLRGAGRVSGAEAAACAGDGLKLAHPHHTWPVPVLSGCCGTVFDVFCPKFRFDWATKAQFFILLYKSESNRFVSLVLFLASPPPPPASQREPAARGRAPEEFGANGKAEQQGQEQIK